MNKNRLILASILIMAILFVHPLRQKLSKSNPPEKSLPVVDVIAAQEVEWSERYHEIGSTLAQYTVDVASSVPGTIEKILFLSGQSVHKGEALVILDHAVLTAQLAQAQAKLRYQQNNVRRYHYLFKQGVIPKVMLEANQSELAEEQARIKELQEEIQLRIIKAPFDGVIGIKQINVGQYFKAGQPMVMLQDNKTILIDFKIPQEKINFAYLGQTIEVRDPQTFKRYIGTIIAKDASVDVKTRTILCQARIENDSNNWLPGMFVSVELWGRDKKKVIMLPKQAINYGLNGTSVFIVEQGKIINRNVDLLEETPESIMVKGVFKNETIVIAGQNKLYEGISVKISES
jgi:membrane fusion protein, multidrug efflux system